MIKTGRVDEKTPSVVSGKKHTRDRDGESVTEGEKLPEHRMNKLAGEMDGRMAAGHGGGRKKANTSGKEEK